MVVVVLNHINQKWKNSYEYTCEGFQLESGKISPGRIKKQKALT